jgi:subtilase family serine protease
VLVIFPRKSTLSAPVLAATFSLSETVSAQDALRLFFVVSATQAPSTLRPVIVWEKVSVRGSGRAEPDLSTNADPYSGYLLYSPSFAQEGDPTLEGGWGGTSFVAPELNGSTAVIDSLLGHRVGFWNPTIYSAATSNKSPFTPLDQAGTSNDNIYYTGNPGAIYNPATGLGTPNIGELASVFATRSSR